MAEGRCTWSAGWTRPRLHLRPGEVQARLRRWSRVVHGSRGSCPNGSAPPGRGPQATGLRPRGCFPGLLWMGAVLPHTSHSSCPISKPLWTRLGLRSQGGHLGTCPARTVNVKEPHMAVEEGAAGRSPLAHPDSPEVPSRGAEAPGPSPSLGGGHCSRLLAPTPVLRSPLSCHPARLRLRHSHTWPGS